MGDRLNIPLPNHPFSLKVLLVRPQHPGNVGAVARAMMNFGFNELGLLDCDLELDDEVRSRSKHAGRVIDEVQRSTTWDEAVADSSLVIGTSGKRETGKRTQFRDFILPWELAEVLSEISGKVTLVMGPEGMGLDREELDRCDMLVTIPTWEGYPVMNLSHATSLLLYELQKALWIDKSGIDPGLPRVLAERELLPPLERELLRESMDELVANLPGPPERSNGVATCLRRVVFRGTPRRSEYHRLMGVFVDATAALSYLKDDEMWHRSRPRRFTPSKDEGVEKGSD